MLSLFSEILLQIISKLVLPILRSKEFLYRILIILISILHHKRPARSFLCNSSNFVFIQAFFGSSPPFSYPREASTALLTIFGVRQFRLSRCLQSTSFIFSLRISCVVGGRAPLASSHGAVAAANACSCGFLADRILLARFVEFLLFFICTHFLVSVISVSRFLFFGLPTRFANDWVTLLRSYTAV